MILPEWIWMIVAAMGVSALFGMLRARVRPSPEQDARDLAATERRIDEIERGG